MSPLRLQGTSGSEGVPLCQHPPMAVYVGPGGELCPEEPAREAALAPLAWVGVSRCCSLGDPFVGV